MRTRLTIAAGLIAHEDKARTAKITIDGDQATVETITDDPEDKSNLVREDGRWLVDADSDSG